MLTAVGIASAHAAGNWDCITTPSGDYRCVAGDQPVQSAPGPARALPERKAATPAASEPTRAVANPAAEPPPATSPASPAPARASFQREVGALPGFSPPLCQPIGTLSAPLPGADQLETRINADHADIEQNERYHLTGHAVIERAGERIMADDIRYDQSSGRADLSGHVLIEKPGMTVRSEQGWMNLDSDQGELSTVDYRLFSRHARGNAVQAFQDNADQQRFEQATYTTCPDNQETWRLDAKRVELDHAVGVGVARHTKLRILDTPVFYTPYISFPIDDRRKSGFLIPSWGSSSQSGTDISIPYYWNIAPNYDATFTPRLLSKRGLQLKGEIRYLQPGYHGELNLEGLPSDKLDNNRNRGFARLIHHWQPSPQLTTDINVSRVSDQNYFSNLGTNLADTSQVYLNQQARASYSTAQWTLSGQLQTFQSLDPAISSSQLPYRRLPQLLFQAEPEWDNYGLVPELNAELVHFDHDNRVTGQRVDIYPRVSRPFGNAGYYLKPELGLRATYYDLSNTQPGDDSRPNRVLPLLSLDSGLFFDRQLRLFGNDYLNTLEPRAYYLYVPEKDQTALPVFDTSLRDLSYQSMFTANRFNGADRVGDANQLTLAVSSRLLTPQSGVQQARFTLGEIFYFRDRTVTLPGQSVATTNSSDLIALAELAVNDRLSFDSGLQWDPYESRTSLGSTRISYHLDDDVLFNFSHRYRVNKLEQLDVSGFWQLTSHWQLAGRWNYSLLDNSLLEGIAAIEYQSCCWVTRLGLSSFINDPANPGNRNSAILLQFELKGLTSFGDPISSLLENGILGYRSKYE